MDLEKHIRDVVDFPKKGIVFKDITPLLKNPEAFEICATKLAGLVEIKIDKVVGVEARGFFFGGLIAQKLKAGFVPVRKKGKLPHDVIEVSYELEYGADVLQIHKDAIVPGEKILIHDDILATGGTAKAVCELVEQLGGEIVQCNFIAVLDFLKGAEKLKYPVRSVFNY